MSAFGGISGRSIGKESFSLMTYNRHGCFSRDDKLRKSNFDLGAPCALQVFQARWGS